jgi:predicted secreted hydrolase
VGIGWAWWGLQLDDGTNVNAYVLRDLKTGERIRSVLTHEGGVLRLDAEPTDWWESPAGVRYPVAWELRGGPFRLRVEPFFRERSCPIFGAQRAIWEGPVRIRGSHTGRGFQELVGYARER